MRCHVAQHARRPERRPAGTHGSDEIGLVLQAEIAFELPGEARSKTIFDQRRGAHHHESARPLDELSPRVEQRLEHFRDDRMIEKAELHRESGAACRARFDCVHSVCDFLQAERGDLNAIRLGGYAKAVRNRQAGAPEPGEVRRLRAEAIRVGGLGRGEGDDQLTHKRLRGAEFIRPPTSERAGRANEFAPTDVMTYRSSNNPASDRRR